VALKRNFSVGLFGSIWSALLGLAVVPLYIKYLGTEAYGLIGFFATTQALLQLLDLGLSPTINREVARCSATNKMQEARSLLHTLSVVYWGMAFVIGLVILALAPLIATHWLQARALPLATISQALMLMGLVVACRWPVGLYMGALMGMQRVALSSMINTAFGTLSSLGTVAVLILVSPTIKAFFIWQALVCAMQLSCISLLGVLLKASMKNAIFQLPT
jgi:O-antigen/teichoic acid export membrane protein